MNRFHRWYYLFDTMTLVDPATLPDRLRRAGFTDPGVDAAEHQLRFRAVSAGRRPPAPPSAPAGPIRPGMA